MGKENKSQTLPTFDELIQFLHNKADLLVTLESKTLSTKNQQTKPFTKALLPI